MSEDKKKVIGEALQSAVAGIGSDPSNGGSDPLSVLMKLVPKLVESKMASDEERESTTEGMERLERHIRVLRRQVARLTLLHEEMAEQMINLQQQQVEAIAELMDHIGIVEEVPPERTSRGIRRYAEIDDEGEELEAPSSRPAPRRTAAGVARSASKSRKRTRSAI